MWETVFDPSMLDGQNIVIIHCPDEALAEELMEVLEAHGVYWGGLGNKNPTAFTNWYEYHEDTCYWVEGDVLTYAEKEYAENGYENHIKCTFVGSISQDFEAASDHELRELLGLGGD